MFVFFSEFMEVMTGEWMTEHFLSLAFILLWPIFFTISIRSQFKKEICFQWKWLFYATSLCSSDSLYFHHCFYIYITFYFIPFVCNWRCVCMFFVLTPVLLYMWNKRPPFILHCVTCPFLCIQITVVQKNVI